MPFPGLFPPEFLSGSRDYRRLRVDVGEPGFFEGRQFYFADEFSIASGATKVYKLTYNVNTIIRKYRFSLDGGSSKLSVWVNATENAAFPTPLAVRPLNAMTTITPYVAANTIASGGTFSGGEEIALERLRTSSATGQRSSSATAYSDVQGRPPSTVFLTISPLAGNTDQQLGILRVEWEERV